MLVAHKGIADKTLANRRLLSYAIHADDNNVELVSLIAKHSDLSLPVIVEVSVVGVSRTVHNFSVAQMLITLHVT